MYNSPLIFSAPQSSAWIWAQSQSLNYSGIWNLTDYNSGIQNLFQSAIFNTPPGSSSSQLQIRLQHHLNNQALVSAFQARYEK